MIAEIFVIGQGSIFFISSILGIILSVFLVISKKLKWGIAIAGFSWLLQIFSIELLGLGIGGL